jgi:hypothetical protein
MVDPIEWVVHLIWILENRLHVMAELAPTGRRKPMQLVPVSTRLPRTSRRDAYRPATACPRNAVWRSGSVSISRPWPGDMSKHRSAATLARRSAAALLYWDASRRPSPVDLSKNLPPEPDDQPQLIERMQAGLEEVGRNLISLLRYQGFGGSQEAKDAATSWLSRRSLVPSQERLFVLARRGSGEMPGSRPANRLRHRTGCAFRLAIRGNVAGLERNGITAHGGTCHTLDRGRHGRHDAPLHSNRDCRAPKACRRNFAAGQFQI